MPVKLESEEKQGKRGGATAPDGPRAVSGKRPVERKKITLPATGGRQLAETSTTENAKKERSRARETSPGVPRGKRGETEGSFQSWEGREERY